MTPLATLLRASIDQQTIWTCSNEEYHADLERESHSTLQIFRASRERYAAERVYKTLARPEPTPEMAFGTLFHTVLLEPERVGDLYIGMPTYDRRTKEGKAKYQMFCKVAEGRIPVAPEDLYKAREMRDGVMRNPAARQILEDDHLFPNETALRCTCPETGVALKARYDLSHVAPLFADIKTTSHDIDPDSFGRTAYNFGYHCQTAFYLYVAKIARGIEANMAHIVVSKTPPYECAVYTLDDAAIALGQGTNLRALAALANCRKTGNWAGQWSQQIHDISLPAYAFRR